MVGEIIKSEPERMIDRTNDIQTDKIMFFVSFDSTLLIDTHTLLAFM